MKNLKSLLILAFVFLVISPALLAQGGGLDNPPVFDFSSAFATFAALVGFIPICVNMFKKIFAEGTHSLAIQIFSWVIGMVITMVGWALSLGFLAGLSWYIALAYGFAASLAANGVADTGILQAILSIFTAKKAK